MTKKRPNTTPVRIHYPSHARHREFDATWREREKEKNRRQQEINARLDAFLRRPVRAA